MTARQLRVRAAVRFAVLTATVGLWFFLAHAIPAWGAALVVGL
ncbi:MAG: hypothetical protein ACLGIS_18130 [Actinomycetes bacterium]